MNLKVVERMMSFDVIARIPGKRNAMGDTIYTTFECKGYPVDDIVAIYNDLGKMVTSSMQLYVCGDDGLQIPSTAILSIGTYKEVQEPGEHEEDEPIIKKVFEPIYQDKTIIKRMIYYKPYRQADVGVFYIP